MITPTEEVPTQPSLSAVEQQIMASMTELLARAGLEYNGSFANVNGTRVHYLDYGEGSPVLLLHGGGAGSAIWFRQIQHLSKSHRVIAPDHPAFGLSEQIGFESPLVESMVRYVDGFMDSLRLERINMIGLSMGAQGALAMAIHMPERVDRLVLIDSAGLGASFPLIFKLANVPIFGKLITRPNRWGQDTYFRTMEVVNSTFEDAEAYKKYAYDVTLPPGHSAAKRKSISAITSLWGQREIFRDDELSSITAPAQIIWGDGDQLFPVEHAYRLAGLLPNSQLHVIENAAHVPLLDRPDEVNGLINGFLRTN